MESSSSLRWCYVWFSVHLTPYPVDNSFRYYVTIAVVVYDVIPQTLDGIEMNRFVWTFQ